MSRRAVILGIGRSGVASAKALAHMGWEPVAVDESMVPSAARVQAAAELVALGVEHHSGWARPLADTGATRVVVSPGVDRRHELLRDALEAGMEIVGEIEVAYEVAKAPIVAITGTNGKSTTTVMTWLGLQAAGKTAHLCGNIYGSGHPERPLAEAALDAGPAAVLVAEISSFQLEWIRGFRPAVAAITNITPDHLNRYENFSEYIAIKLQLFEALGPEGIAIAPLADPKIRPRPGIRCATFGGEGADARVEGGDLVCGEWRTPLASLPLGAPHNALNAQVALLIGRALVCDLDDFAQGLREFHGLAHRMEPAGERDGVRLINNSMCTNPAAVLSSSEGVAANTLHLLVGGQNKGLDFSPLGKVLRTPGRRLYLFGREVQAICEVLGDAVPVFGTLGEAFEAATAAAADGDVVMLAPGCASTDQFADFRERGELFLRLAREWQER